jgi:uncharacterized membrane protein YhaH (DUF805 family)
MQGLTASQLFRYWFTFASPVSPRQYLQHGAALMATKYASDVLIVWLGADRWWMPFDYMSSISTLQRTTLAEAPSWLMPVLALWTLPFLWAGITLTMRRAIDAGKSPWWALLFFVPWANYAALAAFCALPSRFEGPFADQPPRVRDERPKVLMAMLPGLVLGLAMIALSVYALQTYGAALFFATPFGIGAITAWSLNRTASASRGQTTRLVLMTLGLLAALLLGFGREGAVCIAMAAPLAIVLGLMGSAVGRTIALGVHEFRGAFSSAGIGMLALPAAALLEPRAGTGVILHEVQSSVEIAATPMNVWSQVVAFPPMPEPTAWFFRMGVAYPKYARIEGSGVGAVRYCVFSTGPFVEPITIWEPGRRLAFDVQRAPLPLIELTPFDSIAPPHLHGFLESRRGEFRLIALPNGHTRLEGSTWYTVRMGPEGYWQLFGDYLIHQIHLRVLEHIKAQAEGARAATQIASQLR